jgi:hypothetical protein
MDNLENTPAAPASPAQESDLQAQVDNLQKVVTYILVLTIIAGGASALFLRRQAQLTKAELDILRPQKEQIDAQYQKLVGPEVEAFGRKLAEYGATHPDFAPIMAKYGLARPTGPTGAAPVRATSPVTAPAPTKK